MLIDLTYLGFVNQHDSYNICVALSSLILVFGIVCFFLRSRLQALLFFVIVSVAVSQLFMTGKKVLYDQEFQAEARVNTTGVIFSDIAHGFKRLVTLPARIKPAIGEIMDSENVVYSSLEKTNFRYLTMFLMIPVMGFKVLTRKLEPERKKR